MMELKTSDIVIQPNKTDLYASKNFRTVCAKNNI
jgi:hypothetical protein